MAIEYVDSTQLDSDLTSVADAIRAKSGGSGQLAFPSGFVSEIGNIPSGGTEDIKISGADANISFANSTLGKNIVIDAPGRTIGISSLLKATVATNANTEVTINAYKVCGAVETNNAIATLIDKKTKEITKLTLNTTVNPVAGSQFIFGDGSLSKVLGTPISSEIGIGNYRRFNNTNLTEVYLLPNKASTSATITTGVLVDASLVSFANALKAATGQTFTISNATTKAKCSTIVGTVSQVTDDSGTYDFFTQDSSGTVTLADFITNVKGWTLA